MQKRKKRKYRSSAFTVAGLLIFGVFASFAKESVMWGVGLLASLVPFVLFARMRDDEVNGLWN